MQMQTRYTDFHVKQKMLVYTLTLAKHQVTVLAELHLNHSGILPMKALPRLHVWWPTLDTY